MTFEEVLPKLKNGAKIIRAGWSGQELYVKYVGGQELDGKKLNPYLVIDVEGEGYTMFQPTVCDILADDWQIVE